MSEMLAFIPFLHPINFFHEWWYLLIGPLSLGISMIYKALRMDNLKRFWREVATMTLQIILGMIGMALVLMVLVQVVIPALPVD